MPISYGELGHLRNSLFFRSVVTVRSVFDLVIIHEITLTTHVYNISQDQIYHVSVFVNKI